MSGRVAVVGGGVSGLACAHRIHRLRPDVTVEVHEATRRTGGKIATSVIDGIVVDEAADAFLARVPHAVDLCLELGLGDRLVSPAERRAFVYRHGALHRFPEGLVLGVPTDLDALAASGLISARGIERAAQDLTMGGEPLGDGDESVGSLVRRRIGDEVFEAFVGPLLSGVNAGDADELSVAAGAAQFAAAVREQPSLIAGLRAQKEAAVRAGADPDAPVFHGLRGGSQVLTDALVAALPAGAVHLGEPVVRIADLDADVTVLATPSAATSALVRPIDPELADDLLTLEWASVALVTFAVRRSDIDHPLDGSGFLVSEGEGLLMTACSFGSSKWAHWRPDPDADQDVVVLRVSAGRHHDPRALDMTDDALEGALVAELGKVIGLRGDPVQVRISRWIDALPQYRPGHLERARSWKDRAAMHPGLFLTGASYFGLGIPACIADAERTARDVIASLG